MLNQEGYTPPVNNWLIRKRGWKDQLPGTKTGYKVFKKICKYYHSLGNHSLDKWLEEYKELIKYLESL